MSYQANNNQNQNRGESDREMFLKAIATILTGMFSMQESQALVDDVGFWKSLQEINRAGFANSSSILTLAKSKPEYLKNTLRSKGIEHAWVCNYNNDPLNLSGVAKLSESPIDPVGDAYIEDIFSGENQAVQMKTTKKIPNDPGRTARNAKRHLNRIPRKYLEGTLIVGNQPVVDAAKGTRSYNNKTHPIEMGWTDKEETKFIESKYEKAKKGKATPVITIKTVILNIGKAALVGALLFALIETVKDWRAWREEVITGNEFLLRILKQGGKGALLGGGIGALFLLLSSI